METTEITSPAVIPMDQDVVLSWKTSNQEIQCYEICIGASPGIWDQFSARIGKNVRAIKLPELSPDIKSLFVEFSYIIPSESTSSHHEDFESVVLHEAWKISRV